MNCEGCKRRHTSSQPGYCAVFQTMPSIDTCAMHSKNDEIREHLKAKASGQVVARPVDNGHYLWLDKGMLDDHMPVIKK